MNLSSFIKLNTKNGKLLWSGGEWYIIDLFLVSNAKMHFTVKEWSQWAHSFQYNVNLVYVTMTFKICILPRIPKIKWR